MFEPISEVEQFTLFRDAYRALTGERLQLIYKWERPDFICRRPDGLEVGIEFTCITRDPETCLWGSILDGEEFMDPQDCVWAIGTAISRKGQKRAQPDWLLPDSSVLVLSSIDCPVAEINRFLDPDLQGEFEASGFSEIWIADYSELDAFGSAELFGLVPNHVWGYHRRNRGKPFG